MNRNRLLLLLLCVFAAWQLSAQTTPIDVEIGYRFTEIDGNEDMYRTQINEDEGLLIRALTISSVGLGGDRSFMDHFRLDIDELGAGPASSLRLDAGLSNSYRFNLRYRRLDAFNALPAFANPLLGAGAVPGQHTFDRTRDILDADLELLRWGKFRPFVGYTWNRFEGPGTTTWNVGQDEFLLAQDLDESDREFRVGTGFDFGFMQGQITQGWRSFSSDESLTLAPGANNGNNGGAVLGRPISVTGITSEEQTDIDTPFTSFYVTAQPIARLRLIGDYSRFAGESDTTGTDSATGALASFALSRFFNGLTANDTSRAENNAWRGGVRGEFTLAENYDISAGYRRLHRELEGSALINTLYLQSITFGGADPRDIEVILNADNSLERDEDVIDAIFTARPVGPLMFRVGVSQSSSEVTVTPDLSEITVQGGQGGTFERGVTTVLLDGSYSIAGFNVGASLQRDSADDPILRTDFIDRDRYRVRAGWKAPRWFRVGVTAEETQQENDDPEIAYDAKLRQITADLEFAPVAALSFRASASQFRSDSSILFRRPENFNVNESVHVEEGDAIGGGLTAAWSRFTLDGDLSRFENEGSLPFELDRSRVRLMVQIVPSIGVGAEWAQDEYHETNLPAADFDATRYGVFLRLRR
jgi:hypothetical protein